MQDCRISTANVLEILHYCTISSICTQDIHYRLLVHFFPMNCHCLRVIKLQQDVIRQCFSCLSHSWYSLSNPHSCGSKDDCNDSPHAILFLTHFSPNHRERDGHFYRCFDIIVAMDQYFRILWHHKRYYDVIYQASDDSNSSLALSHRRYIAHLHIINRVTSPVLAFINQWG